MAPALAFLGCVISIPLIRWGVGRLPPRLLPWLVTLPLLPVYTLCMREGRLGAASAATFLWSLGVYAGAAWNGLDASRVGPHRGELVAAGLATWVQTGLPAGGSSRARWRRTRIHAFVISLSSLVSGGLLALPLAASFLLAEGHAGGRLGCRSTLDPLVTAVLASGPWGPMRWLGHAFLSVAFGAPVLAPVDPSPWLFLAGAVALSISTIFPGGQLSRRWALYLRQRLSPGAV